jgi:hypothetical protein
MSRVSGPTTVVPTREIIADFRVSPTESPQHRSEPPNPKTFLDLVKVQNVQKSIGSAVGLSVWHFLLSFQFLLAHFFLQQTIPPKGSSLFCGSILCSPYLLVGLPLQVAVQSFVRLPCTTFVPSEQHCLARWGGSNRFWAGDGRGSAWCVGRVAGVSHVGWFLL